MSTIHIAQQGDCISSIALSYGFSDWRKIYDHPENAELRNQRQDPNVFFPGDRVYIPDHELKWERKPTDQKHVFEYRRRTTQIRIKVKDEDDQPYASKRYLLVIAEEEYEGMTGDDGLIAKRIDASATAGELTVWVDEHDESQAVTWPLAIGHLDPPSEITGIQGRLNNLGFACGPVDGINGPRTQAVVKAFQAKQGLPVDGIATPQTIEKLQQIHGS